VSPKHLRVFDFVDEIHKSRTNWITFYENVDDILLALKTNLLTLDESDFVTDLDIADGESVPLETTFRKTWQIRNNGMVTWKNRKLCEDNPGASGLIPKQPCVSIPDTEPGQIVTVSVEFTAPSYPATCKSIWRMRGENNQYCFPKKVGVWCKVHVSHR
jgi:Ig-like domain from next to BRCA1 gene